MLRHVLAVSILLTAPVMAQVRVVESVPRVSPGVSQPQYSESVSPDIYSQIRSLQDEIANLRGLIEEQTYELNKLKQLQLDNYMELDRRLSSGSRAQIDDSPLPAAPLIDTPVDSYSLPVEDSRSEKEIYTAAYDLLNQRDYDAATNEFKNYLGRFPTGQYASNSCYWLGKIANQNRDYEQAKSWFAKLISDFPDTAKVPDAKYDLGRVYFNMGDKVKAKAIMQDVAGGSSDAARLAKKFLRDNF
jgi:tol-pal system protein YbgF